MISSRERISVAELNREFEEDFIRTYDSVTYCTVVLMANYMLQTKTNSSDLVFLDKGLSDLYDEIIEADDELESISSFLDRLNGYEVKLFEKLSYRVEQFMRDMVKPGLINHFSFSMIRNYRLEINCVSVMKRKRRENDEVDDDGRIYIQTKLRSFRTE